MTRRDSRNPDKAQTHFSTTYNPLACIYCRRNHQKTPNRIDVAGGLDCNDVSLFLPPQE